MSTGTMGQMDVIESPASVNNLDVLNLVGWLDRIVSDIANSQSSTLHTTLAADVIRLERMIEVFEKRFSVASDGGNIDMPKYQPFPLTCPAPPALNIIQNQDLMGIINLLCALRVELSLSQSSEVASGFITDDSRRVGSLIGKWKAQVDTIKSDPSIDLPDVDPQEPPAQG